MSKIVNKQVIESSSLFLDLSESLLNKIDDYLVYNNLDVKQQKELIKIFEEIYSEGYTNSISD
jgi:hypothetical protein